MLSIDHINHDKTDNRIENLRQVTHSENHKNRKYRKNTSGCTGVNIYKRTGKWIVTIAIEGVGTNLGYYSDFFEACCVRKSAEVQHGYHLNHGR